MNDASGSLEARVPYVLPADALLLSPETVAPSIATKFEAIISRTQARLSSRALSRDLADLLREFTRPSSIAEAVARYAKKHQVDPREVLKSALKPLAELREAGYLEDGSVAEPASVQSLPEQIAHRADGVQLLSTKGAASVFRVVHREHGVICVRVAGKNDLEAVARLRTEQTALAAFSQRRIPRLLAVDEDDTSVWHVSTWIEGARLAEIIESYRRTPGLFSRRMRGLTAHSFLTLLADIHADGYVHGDIALKNFISEVTGEVFAIDFESSVRNVNPSEICFETTLHYIAPEQVGSCQDGTIHKASQKAEQFAAGVVAAEIMLPWCKPDLHISMENLLRRVQSGQIRVELLAHRQAAEDCVIECLAKALHPSPEHRYADVGEFAHAFEAALQRSTAVAVEYRFDSFQTDIAGRGSSLNTRLAAFVLRQGEDALGGHSADDSLGGIATEFVGPIHFRHVPEFVAAFDLLVGNDGRASHDETQDLYRTVFKEPISGDEPGIVTGAGARLQLLSAIAQRFSPPVDQSTGDALLAQNLQVATASSGAFDFLGIAHGPLGNALAAAVWCNVTGATLPLETAGIIVRRVEEELELHQANLSGPSCTEGWWCRGLPGYINLLAELRLASPALQVESLLERCAARLDTIQPSDWTLCCGLLGQVVAFHTVFKIIRQSAFESLARARLAQARELAAVSPHINSVWKGHLGLPLVQTLLTGGVLQGTALLCWTAAARQVNGL